MLGSVNALGSVGGRVVVQHGPVRQHKVEDRGAEVEAGRLALGVKIADELLDIALRYMRRNPAGQPLGRDESAGRSEGWRGRGYGS